MVGTLDLFPCTARFQSCACHASGTYLPLLTYLGGFASYMDGIIWVRRATFFLPSPKTAGHPPTHPSHLIQRSTRPAQFTPSPMSRHMAPTRRL
ncbi:hypothetical protein LY76DRAFT_79120 [Colletotrichum caudatum]|nr:hypothetical protein LY76DRAFT_79120 [Colletotrichum caudatum]